MTTHPASSIEHVLAKAEQQPVLFASGTPKRSALLQLQQHWTKQTLSLAVHRNEPVEYIFAALAPFAGFADLEVAATISDYDDSLGFANAQDWNAPSVHLVWLDYERYATLASDQIVDWLEGRLRALRALSAAPILVASAVLPDPDAHGRETAINEGLAALADKVSGVQIYPRAELRDSMGQRYWSARFQAIGSTKESGAAAVEHARLLGMTWLPAATRPRLKALVLDLDNTLYNGVLGEDGIEGVGLSDDHLRLHKDLIVLQESGLLLTVASRNEQRDVDALLSTRTDFPLRPSHLSVVKAAWDRKSNLITEIANRLGIGTDAILFIDDNTGELAEVAAALPGIKTLHAAAPDQVASALRHFPNLLPWKVSETDLVRARDLAAKSEREALQAGAEDREAYLKALGITLRFHTRPHDHRARLHAIANKTNQFILSFARFTEADVDSYLVGEDRACVAFFLKDRLADSGNVGAVFAHREGDQLIIDELCVSCRALGRGIDTCMVASAVKALLKALPASTVRWKYKVGPRNKPGLDWLRSLTGQDLPGEHGDVTITAADVVTHADAEGNVEREWFVEKAA